MSVEGFRNNDNRDMIIRVDQQIKDSIDNQKLILKDLKEIFQRLEKESKLSVAMSGDLKGHLESSRVRWDELNKKLEIMNKSIRTLDTELKNEISDRKTFQESLVVSFKTTKVFITILAAFATILSVVVLLIK